MNVLEIQSLIFQSDIREVTKDFSLNSVVNISGADLQSRINFLKCLGGAINPISGNILYKKMNIHTFKKSYFKNGRVFIDQEFNFCYNKSLFLTKYKKNIKNNRTVWQNLKSFSKLNKNEEFVYAAVHYFLFHDIVDKKVSSLEECEKELLKISTAMFFENIDFWIIFIDDTKIKDEADIKILRHLLHSRASDCDGIVFYATYTNNSINVPNEQMLVLEKQLQK